MEIIVVILLAYIGYHFFKSGILSKAMTATEIQKRFERISHTAFVSFDGDMNSAAQSYVDRYWDNISEVRRLKPHHLLIAALIMLNAARDLHNGDDDNADFVMLAFISTLNDIPSVVRIPSPTEAVLLQNMLDTFTRISNVRNPPIKDMEQLKHERFMGAETDKEDRQSYQDEALLRVLESGLTIDEAMQVHKAMGKVYDEQKAKEK